MGESTKSIDLNRLLVSIVVPVYNVERYLRRCIDSILIQTYRNLEVILVDDGSPDNCPAICDKYAKEDARVKVIHKMNGGLSDARNVGMTAASGDYLMFVDSDDWLENTAVETLYGLAMKYDAQIVIGGMQRVEDDTDIIFNTTCCIPPKERCLTKVQAMKDFFNNGCAAWGRLYLRTIHNGINFPIGEINEDEAVVLSLFERCKTVVQVDTVVYNYRFRPQSITTSSFSEKKLVWYKHCISNLAWVERNHPELIPYAKKRLCTSILYSAHEIAIADQDYREYLQPILLDLKLHYRDYKTMDWHYKERIKLWAWRYIPYNILRLLKRKNLKRYG